MSRVLEGFAGPGGFSEAARMLDLGETLGIELNRDACATATAAGHPRLHGDIRSVNPYQHHGVTGWVSGPPCPTYADSGKRTGRADFDIVLGGAQTLFMQPKVGDDPYTATYREVADERSALVLETLRLALEIDGLEWIVAEQVPAVERIWWDFAASLATEYWESCHVVTLRADDFGLPTRRTRRFLIAARQYTPDFTGMPIRSWWRTGRNLAIEEPASQMLTPFPRVSMAAALGWPAGVRVNTRGDRKTPGGNEFSADAPAPGLTYTARSWFRTDLGKPGGYLEPWQAGLMQGFPRDYPWHGSRTSCFQQAADSVPPLMGAAVLGVAAAVPWQDAVWGRLSELYGVEPGAPDQLRPCDTGRAPREQLDLFGTAA
ncbi:hypothetical protein AB0K34_13650 [Actinomadura sp. NPDC049382]|uniref:hypothetical protein n=1 Tax=Actinomadura sp. NPDC049382 TaxID=3158220 RepID=UPI00343CF8B6